MLNKGSKMSVYRLVIDGNSSSFVASSDEKALDRMWLELSKYVLLGHFKSPIEFLVFSDSEVLYSGTFANGKLA